MISLNRVAVAGGAREDANASSTGRVTIYDLNGEEHVQKLAFATRRDRDICWRENVCRAGNSDRTGCWRLRRVRVYEATQSICDRNVQHEYKQCAALMKAMISARKMSGSRLKVVSP